MARVLCQVVRKKPERSTYAVAVPTALGHREFLEVPEGFVTEFGGKQYLPVALVGKDKAKNMALVQLPFETDSGANRVWVPFDNMLDLDVEEALT